MYRPLIKRNFFLPPVLGAVKKQNLKNLLLISLDWTRPKDPPMSLGHASILAHLKAHQMNVNAASWAVNSAHFSPQQVVDFIMSNAKPHTDVALGAFVWNEMAIQVILRDLKKFKFPGKIILGGAQISYVKNTKPQVLENLYPQADIFVRGYAEDALVQWMQDTNPFPVITGIHYANQPDLGLTAISNLEILTSPFLNQLIPKQRFIRWETQRGCPFKCAFCQHREPNPTMKRRELCLPRVLKEAEWITSNPIIQDVAVLDPIFNSGANYLEILDHFIKGKFSGKLALQCRLEMVKPIFLDKIVELNKTANVVLEFGLQTIHREETKLIERPNNLKVISEVLYSVHACKIKCEVSLIFGLPNQTLASFQESIDFCKRHHVPVIHAFPLMLLRGTPLYDEKEKLGLKESYEIASPEIDRLQSDIPHVVSSPSFSYEEWKIMAKMAEALETNYNRS